MYAIRSYYDDFKQVNDTFGHLVGDKFLIELGNILTTNTRDVDFVGRWGGEEFRNNFV